MAELTANKNYLQPTGFRIVLSRKNYPNLVYFAQGVTHPGANVNPIELATRRVTSVPLAGEKISYSELSVEFICDEDMMSYKEMQNWLERMVNEGQVSESQSLHSGKTPTYSDITVHILSSHNNKNVEIRYKDCIPTTIGSIELSANASDVQYVTFNAGFRFSSFEIV